MSDEEYDETSEQEDESTVMKELRKAAREGKAAAAERDALKRDLAFRDAGVPVTKATSYFSKAYDGELDAESIKAAAVEAGFLTEDKPEDEGVSAEERAAAERVAGAATGATDVTPPGYEEEVAAAKTPEQLLAVLAKYGVETVSK